MVTVYGMNDKVGKVSFYDPQQENTFTKPYSEETGKLIDDEVRKLVDEAYARTKALLTEKREEVEKIALALLDREVLQQHDVEELLGKRPFEEKKIFSEDQTDLESAIPTGEAPAPVPVPVDKDDASA
jgi:cell division protease FtsH